MGRRQRQTKGKGVSSLPTLEAYDSQSTGSGAEWSRCLRTLAEGPGPDIPPHLSCCCCFRRARPWEGRQEGEEAEPQLQPSPPDGPAAAPAPGGGKQVVPGQPRQTRGARPGVRGTASVAWRT